VEQERLTFQEHLSSSLLFCEVCVAQCLVLFIMGCTLFSFLFWTLYCFLWFMASDYPLWLLITLFGIFKLFSVIYNKYSILMRWRNRRKPPTCHKSLTNFITLCFIEYTSPLTGFGLTTLVVMGTDYTASCKSNYHTITTTTAPLLLSSRYCIYYISQRKVWRCQRG
jgi:hypothetical protein